jgi:hypothetical protein
MTENEAEFIRNHSLRNYLKVAGVEVVPLRIITEKLS